MTTIGCKSGKNSDLFYISLWLGAVTRNRRKRGAGDTASADGLVQADRYRSFAAGDMKSEDDRNAVLETVLVPG